MEKNKKSPQDIDERVKEITPKVAEKKNKSKKKKKWIFAWQTFMFSY